MIRKKARRRRPSDTVIAMRAEQLKAEEARGDPGVWRLYLGDRVPRLEAK